MGKTRSPKQEEFLYQSWEGKMNFEKCFCFDGENMPNSARYYTDDKSKLLGDVSFIKKNNYPKNKLMW